jgi:hypothetical protein
LGQVSTKAATKGSDLDLTPRILEALGKRIEDPAAVQLAAAIGKKPFKNVSSDNSYVGNRKALGLEAMAKNLLYNRAYWPPRKDGRRWVTWVTTAWLNPNYKGTLPDGFDFAMDEAALSARFEREAWTQIPELTRFTLPAPRPGLIASTTVDVGGLPRHVYLAVEEEWPYATVYPGSNVENSFDDAFFAAWCAANGLLHDGRVGADALPAISERSGTPLTFFSTALGGLLWSGDVKPEYQPFCKAYMGTIENSEANASQDVKDVFGENNYWHKQQGEPITPDDWASYDRIEQRFTTRLDEWRRGVRWTMPNERKVPG